MNDESNTEDNNLNTYQQITSLNCLEITSHHERQAKEFKIPVNTIVRFTIPQVYGIPKILKPRLN